MIFLPATQPFPTCIVCNICTIKGANVSSQ